MYHHGMHHGRRSGMRRIIDYTIVIQALGDGGQRAIPTPDLVMQQAMQGASAPPAHMAMQGEREMGQPGGMQPIQAYPMPAPVQAPGMQPIQAVAVAVPQS